MSVMLNNTTTPYIMMKIVITGPSSSGKSKVIEELKNKGYSIINESAREILEKNKNEESNKESIRERQLEMINTQLSKENNISADKVFLDRGIIDYLVYTRYFGINTKIEGLRDIDLYYRYDKVFSLVGLPFIKDDIRTEKDYHEAKKIYDKIIKTYEMYCHDIITVPIFSDDEKENIIKRTEYIIVNIK